VARGGQRREAEVDEAHRAAPRQAERVLGLQVAVVHADGVRGGDAPGDLLAPPGGFGGGARRIFEEVARHARGGVRRGLLAAERHRDEGLAVDAPGLAHVDDVVAHDAGGRAGLGHDAAHGVHPVRVEELQRDRGVHAAVDGLPHLAARALAEAAHQLEGADAHAGGAAAPAGRGGARDGRAPVVGDDGAGVRRRLLADGAVRGGVPAALVALPGAFSGHGALRMPRPVVPGGGRGRRASDLQTPEHGPSVTRLYAQPRQSFGLDASRIAIPAVTRPEGNGISF
jgi:hypothetical protein